MVREDYEHMLAFNAIVCPRTASKSLDFPYENSLDCKIITFNPGVSACRPLERLN